MKKLEKIINGYPLNSQTKKDLLFQIKEWACGRLEKKKKPELSGAYSLNKSYAEGHNQCHDLSKKNIKEGR